MAVKRRPVVEASAAELAFIGSAAKAPAEARQVPTMIRIDSDLLARIDAAAKSRFMTRSAWLRDAALNRLDAEEK